MFFIDLIYDVLCCYEFDYLLLKVVWEDVWVKMIDVGCLIVLFDCVEGMILYVDVLCVMLLVVLVLVMIGCEVVL